jgi:hypothetical protein
MAGYGHALSLDSSSAVFAAFQDQLARIAFGPPNRFLDTIGVK